MAKRYDVIIVGAGVAGISLAHFLRNSPLKILLIEKRNTIKKLENHRFGLTRGRIDKYGLQRLIIKEYDKFAIGPNDPQEWVYFKHTGKPFVVIDMNILAKGLRFSGDIKTSTQVRSVTRTTEGLTVNDQHGNAYTAKIIVDCSGPAQVVSNCLGIRKERNEVNYLNTSLELTGCNIPEAFVEIGSFPMDFRYATVPLWIYPYSKTACQFGQPDIVAKGFPLPKNQQRRIYDLMKNVEPYKTWFKHAKIKERVRRQAIMTITRPFALDNLLACGEAAGATAPVLGEGSGIAIEMAASAAQVIEQAFANNDFSKKMLKAHERNFHDVIGKYYRMSELLKFIWMRYIGEAEFREFCRNMARLNEEDYLRFYKSEITLGLVLRLLRPKLFFMIFRNAVRYHAFTFTPKPVPANA